MLRQYLGDMINNHKTRREQQIQLTMSINFSSSKDSNETRTMHNKSHNIEIMMGSETDKTIKKVFQSLVQNHHKYLEETIRRSEFISDSDDLLYYRLQKISLKRGESYIDSPKWLKKNTNNKSGKNDDNCFQYALTLH